MFLILFFIDAITALNIQFLHSELIGGIFLALYLLFNGYLAGRSAGKIFLIEEAALRLFAGALIVFLAVSSLLGIFITFSNFSYTILSVIVFLVGAALIMGNLSALSSNAIPKIFLKDIKLAVEYLKTRIASLEIRSLEAPVSIMVLLLFAIGFYTLFSSGNREAYIRSPWEAIPDQFILVILFLSAFILYKIIVKPKPFLLVPIILFSFLQHSYIPAVYRLPYGGDTWRHVASMMQIEDDGFLPPSSYDTFSIGPITVPSSTLTVSSYASFWASGIFLNRTLQIDLVTLMVWWQYILFSIALPVLFFLLFKHIFENHPTASLLGAFLPSVFFPMQAYGAVSLPLGFGFLPFAVFLLAVISWLKTRERKYLAAIFVLLALLLMHYVVYFLFGALIVGFLFVEIALRRLSPTGSRLIRIGYLMISIALIPVASLFVSPNARLDVLTTGADHIWDFWKHTFLYVFGLKGMEGYYLHTGNLVWHSMRDRFIELPPFSWDYLDTVLFFFFVFAISASVFWMCRSRKISASPVTALFLYILFVGLMSIFLDRSYLGGIHLLTERLDLIIITAFIFFLVGGYMAMFKYKKRFVFLGASVLIIAVMIGSTYASGPIHGRVTQSHYKAMRALYEDMERTKRTDYCVLSEHFPLAALEVASRGRVKNGNFPIKYGYLEEGGKIFIKMFSRPDLRWMKEAAREIGARGCYLILDKRFLADWNKTQIRWLLGREVIEVDDVHIWLYDGEKK